MAVQALSHELDQIASQHRAAQLVGQDGKTMKIPDPITHALTLVVQSMARGQSVTVVPHEQELTTQEAADILHVSRPHLVKLLDDGAIPHHKVGSHRRVKTEDVFAYRRQRADHRATQLDELSRISQEVDGGYR
jgi:excisionase family DNA binding protein